MQIDPAAWEAIISGRRRGPTAALARAGLRLLEGPYGAAVRWRNWRYDRGASVQHRVGVPVISVGNLTTGGTGKTPLVAWIARWLRRQQLRVALISRGYGAEHGGVNDEALELEQQLPDVPHVQNRDRVAAACLAIEEFFSQILVLDDAFQHRRIVRDLDVVLLDALQPLGYDHLLPRGLLREPVCGLRRAHAVGISRADLIEAPQRDALRQLIQQHAPSAALFEVAHRPVALISAQGERLALDQLAREPVLAFCGIGNPTGFRRTLEQLGCEVKDLRVWPDHHAYTREDIDSLQHWAATDASHVKFVLCTRKDMVKIGLEKLANVRLYALAIETHFLAGQAALEQLLTKVASNAPRDE